MLVNVFTALEKRISVRRIAILRLLERQPCHSTSLAKRLSTTRQLIDHEIKFLSERKLVTTTPAKIGQHYKPHRLTAGGANLLETLSKPSDISAHGIEKIEDGRGERKAPKKQPCRVSQVSSEPEKKEVSSRP